MKWEMQHSWYLITILILSSQAHNLQCAAVPDLNNRVSGGIHVSIAPTGQVRVLGATYILSREHPTDHMLTDNQHLLMISILMADLVGVRFFLTRDPYSAVMPVQTFASPDRPDRLMLDTNPVNVARHMADARPSTESRAILEVVSECARLVMSRQSATQAPDSRDAR